MKITIEETIGHKKKEYLVSLRSSEILIGATVVKKLKDAIKAAVAMHKEWCKDE